jgi:hypothetical protein
MAEWCGREKLHISCHPENRERKDLGKDVPFQ